MSSGSSLDRADVDLRNLPTLTLRLPRVNGEFVAHYAEKQGGHTWEIQRNSPVGWDWVSRQISPSEVSEVAEQIREAISLFRSHGRYATMILGAAFEDNLDEDERFNIYHTAHGMTLCLRAVEDLTEALDSLGDAR